MVGFTTRAAAERAPARDDRRDDEHGAGLVGREAGREHGGARRIEQREAALRSRILGAAGALVVRRRVFLRDLLERGAACVDLGRDERGDRLGLFARRALGDQRGARVEPVEHEQAETEREGADDAREREEELQPDAEPRRARADEARRDERDEQDEEDRRTGRDQEARHGASPPRELGRSLTR